MMRVDPSWSALFADAGAGWEALVLAVLVGVAALAARLGARRGGHDEDSVLFGRVGVDGALFPALALLLALLAQPLLPLIGVKPTLWRFALPLLVSLLLIRVAARVLRRAWPQALWARTAERWVSWLAWGGSVLWITGLWPRLWAELDALQWKMGGSRISLATLLEACFAVVAVLVVTLWLSAAIETRLLRGARADTLSARKIAANLVKALLLFVGLLLALSSAGIDLTALSVLGGALGVGLGFGLQKLAANYVSGFVILAEQSLRIGDMVKVDGFEGRISDIKTRFTVIRAANGRESLVPNELLITQRVENSSAADPKVQLLCTLTVDADTELAPLRAQLQTAIAAVPRVLATPAPAVWLSEFTPEGLGLTLAFWIQDPDNGSAIVRSEVNLAALEALRRAGVRLATRAPRGEAT